MAALLVPHMALIVLHIIIPMVMLMEEDLMLLPLGMENIMEFTL